MGRAWQKLNVAIRRSLNEISLAQLAGLDPEEADDLLTGALISGAREVARAIVVHDGELKRCWLMPRAPVGSGRR